MAFGDGWFISPPEMRVVNRNRLLDADGGSRSLIEDQQLKPNSPSYFAHRIKVFVLDEHQSVILNAEVWIDMDGGRTILGGTYYTL